MTKNYKENGVINNGTRNNNNNKRRLRQSTNQNKNRTIPTTTTRQNTRSDKMNDWDCLQIQTKAMMHLIICAFDDYRITTQETTKALNEIRNRIKEKEGIK